MAAYLFILAAILSMVTTQTIDEAVLNEIFGTPPPTTVLPTPSTPKLEDFTVRPTDENSVFTDPSGDECKCLPYYLCDNSKNGVFANNVSVTGYGTLDIRFGEEKCQESVEICCKIPKSEEMIELTTPPPKPIRGCGYRNPQGLDFTITGGSGSEAEFGEFPWVVALLGGSEENYIGVGVLIHPSVVMTAAHVVQKYKDGQIKIRAGEWDTQTVKERLKHQTRNVQQVVIHKDFRVKNLWNDMALLKLEEPVELAEHINTICLPDQDENFENGRNCFANGWGKDVFGGPGRYAVILKKIELNMVPHGLCTSLLQRTRLGPRFQLHSSFVCAGGEEGKDTCQGDGGAPLVCPVGENRYKLTGLVAWGIGCGQRHVPAVYVNAAMFRSWVDNKMAEWGLEIGTN